MENAYRLGEVEEIIAGMELMEVPDDIMESDVDYQIVISGWWVHIPELGLNLHEGVFCNYDGEEGGYLPDFAITVVKEEGQEEWIYYEQDGFLITLANYLHGKRIDSSGRIILLYLFAGWKPDSGRMNLPDTFKVKGSSDKKKYFIVQKDRKGGTYGVFNPVKRSEQPGQEREGICNDCAGGQLQGHECSSA